MCEIKYCKYSHFTNETAKAQKALRKLPKIIWPVILLIAIEAKLLALCMLGRKVMTNLDGIFKSRDITLPSKVHLVKAMVFPVGMYGCESWTVKKAER